MESVLIIGYGDHCRKYMSVLGEHFSIRGIVDSKFDEENPKDLCYPHIRWKDLHTYNVDYYIISTYVYWYTLYELLIKHGIAPEKIRGLDIAFGWLEDAEKEILTNEMYTNKVYKGGCYYTQWRRPIYADDVLVETECSNSKRTVAIVLQGPIVKENHFTRETVKLYKRIFPECVIIVSSWIDEKEYADEYLMNIADSVVLSEYPSFGGSRNINYQIVSSYRGILEAENFNVRYVLKSRCDQRIYYQKAIDFLKALIDKYPVKIKSSADSRIVAYGMGTYSDRMYGVTDMFLFGTYYDILRYFSCPLKQHEDGIVNYEDQEELSRKRHAEMYLTSMYLESSGHVLKWTLEDSDYLRNNLYIIIDSAMVDLYWPKYTDLEYRCRRYDNYPIYKEVTFVEWFMAQ